MTKGFIWTFETEGTILPLLHLKEVQEKMFLLLKNKKPSLGVTVIVVFTGRTVSVLRSWFFSGAVKLSLSLTLVQLVALKTIP